jgi:hypothetical protein
LSKFKQIVVYSGLVLLTLWPLFHVGLVKRYDVNAWKLAGWGMYSVPQIPADVRILCHTPDDVGTYPLRTIRPELEPAMLEFRVARLGLGALVEPDRLARALLEYYTAIDGVSVVVVQPVLNRRTGMIEDEFTTYDYDR